MKNINIFLIILTIFSIVTSCKSTEKTSKITLYKDSISISTGNEIIIDIKKGKAFNHPTFVIWKENLEGNIVETIFITKSYATGIFGHRLVGDSIWLPTPGSSFQPAALPYWTFKKGLIDNKTYIPTPEHPYVDAYTGATPVNDFKIKTSSQENENKYRILLEVNQTWDWNYFWTNNKYPDSNPYKHSAQPSIIYSVTINNQDSVYFLNPIGHGDALGENGKLYTDLSTLTSAKEIFDYIKISIK